MDNENKNDNENDPLFLVNKYKVDNNCFFCSNNTLLKLKKVLHIMDMPLLIKGKKGIGKKSTIFKLLKYVPDLKYLDMNDNLFEKKLSIIKNDTLNNMYKYENLFYINFELYVSNDYVKILKFITNISKSRLHNERKVIFLTNIDLIGITNQKILSNIVEKYNSNCAYIFTANSSNNIKKLNNMLCVILFPYLNETDFVTKFNIYYKHLFPSTIQKNSELYFTKFYEIYKSNNHNINNTLYHINYLYSENLITKKDLNNITNINSVINKLVIKLINKLLSIKKIIHLDDIRTELYKLLSINLNESFIIENTISILLKLNIKNEQKYKLCNIASNISKQLPNCDKDTMLLENFFINVFYIINFY